MRLILAILLGLILSITISLNLQVYDACLHFKFAHYRIGFSEPYWYCVTTVNGTEFTIPLRDLLEIEKHIPENNSNPSL
jgi:hypothetical protein